MEVWTPPIVKTPAALTAVAQVLAAVLRERCLAHGLELVAADGDEARVGAVDPADDVQQGGLARAGRAEQDADLAARDRKRHPAQDLLPGLTAAVALFQIHDLQKFVFFCHDILFLCKRAGMRRASPKMAETWAGTVPGVCP